VQIVAHYKSAGFRTRLMLVRARAPVPPSIEVCEALPGLLRSVPWRVVRNFGISSLDRQFIRQLRTLDPDKTVIDVWPGWPSPILPEAKRLGFTVVRTMINTACAMSRGILDEAFERQGMAPEHDVSDALVEAETNELQQYDYIFSSNAEVDRSLALIGIPESRILRTSFGWDPARFEATEPERKPAGKLRFLFVGTVGIRKGVPELLDAWRRAGLANAELLIIGNVEESYRERFAASLPPGARHMPFSMNIGGFYKSSDVFVFPTLEEGGPQVVYEAAGCGAAIVTTPMGQARMVETGVNGLVVPPADAEALADALVRLAGDAALLERMKAAARESAKKFEYAVVGAERGAMLRAILDRRTERAAVAVRA
jgi:glycosyltransferase involved in cell wall biosynthesis